MTCGMNPGTAHERATLIFKVHCKKGLSFFPSPAGMSLTKLSLVGKNVNVFTVYSLREWVKKPSKLEFLGGKNKQKAKNVQLI
jgi:hypothetical protein